MVLAAMKKPENFCAPFCWGQIKTKARRVRDGWGAGWDKMSHDAQCDVAAAACFDMIYDAMAMPELKGTITGAEIVGMRRAMEHACGISEV